MRSASCSWRRTQTRKRWPGKPSDLVDDALALIRHWAARGEHSFQPLAVRFFHYGTQLYRFHQPHFLAEFIQENLG